MSSENSDTKTRILKATLALLEKCNGTGVRMSDIAKKAKVSRQALYLHFSTRAELFVEATYFLDRLKDMDARLVKSRSAKSGTARLDAYIEAWGNYIPQIYPALKTLMIMRSSDSEAAIAWKKRMQDMREGCEAAILALEKDGRLHPDYSTDQASDLLWSHLSVANWEQLTLDCRWSQTQYINNRKAIAKNIFVT